jgi:hypothetical protein
MPDRANDEGRLDRALRDLVAGEAPADLRRRVMARISLASQRSRVVPRLAWAAGLAAAIVAFVLLARPDRPARPPRHVVSATPSAPVVTPSPPQEATASPAAVMPRGSRATGRSAEAPENWPFVDALPTPEPVGAAPLRNDELVIRRIAVPGLEVGGLDIEPLEPS